ncbi:unnamed protein product [Paramecium pentaurelia]|uniref:Uncharacterized protein n=1 Tax=Paramecium pentaurelia TaxID=43138 RepID=A0A8S1TRT3_9CILI|nr:unnamed protein product [Paramecium pentaurelia]
MPAQRGSRGRQGVARTSLPMEVIKKSSKVQIGR